MSAATLVTHGLGSFSDAALFLRLGLGAGAPVIEPPEVPTGQGNWNLGGKRKYTAIVNGRRYVGTVEQIERLVAPVAAKAQKSDLPKIEVAALEDTDGPALREAQIVAAQIRAMFDRLHSEAELDAAKAEADEMEMIVAVLTLL